jgi:hypothetical protein
LHHAVDVADVGANLFDPAPLTPRSRGVAALFITRQLERLLVEAITQLCLPLSQ